MKKILTFLGILSLLGGCTKAPEPENEKNAKGHDEAAKIQLVFSQESDRSQQQIFTFELDEATKNIVRKKDGRTLGENEAPLVLDRNQKYILEMTYFNIRGEVMNGEFLTEVQRPIHQHFFTINSYKDASGQEFTDTSGVWDYAYQDEDNDPVGLKGIFTPHIGDISFSLRVRLFHITSGNKYINNRKENGVYPFNKPETELLVRATTDFDQKIPVIIR